MLYKAWLIYNGGINNRKFSDIHQWYIETAKKINIKLELVSNLDLYIGVDQNKLSLDNKNNRPDFVLFLDKDIRLAQHLERLAIPVFNKAEAIELCDSKIFMHQCLAIHELPQPKTIFAPMLFQDKQEIDQQFLNYVEDKLLYPLIIKEAYGSFGEQVYFIKNRGQLEEKARHLLHTPHLYQQYIQSSNGQDIRLHVVGNRVVAAMKRVSEHDFRANVTSGGKMYQVEPKQTFLDLAVKASQAVKADFSGVDLLIGEKGDPIICEVNSNAHIKNIYDCTGVDVSKDIFQHIIATLKGYSNE
ncbi:ATP-grasp domain-containing protein [Amphibacillus cookii]|uniref:ATP-grasp domain-containing protein n=1 Tax=Amphibacillus cookii TaxID=767787 RepID=UPI00195EF93D|nr:RimK family alpha-L-glutamate ligase [Amphibacillus cookii]MBM7539932.1 RimK family alpha-L-glutamate ligase [Amphibacillus cookii]